VCFSVNGHAVGAIEFNKCIRTWNSQTGELIGEFQVDDAMFLDVIATEGQVFPYRDEGMYPASISGDGTKIAFLDRSDRTNSRIVVFDMMSKSMKTLRDSAWRLESFVFSTDGNALIYIDRHRAGWRLWRLDEDTSVDLPHGGTPPGGTFSYDGTRIVAPYFIAGISLLDAESLEEIQTFDGHSGRVYSCALSKDSTTLVSEAGDCMLRLWDVETGRLRSSLAGHTAPIINVAICPNQQSIASCPLDGTLRIWRAARPEDVPTKLEAELE